MKTNKILHIIILIVFILSCNKEELKWDLPKMPEVTTLEMQTVLDITATAGGYVSRDGGSPIIKRGVCYSISPKPTLNNSFVESSTGTGNYTCALTGLSSETEYYLRAFATNKVGTAYGNEVYFTTKGLASIVTNAVSLITATSAWSGGVITSNGGLSIIEKGICYGKNQSPTIKDTKINSGSGTSSFTSGLSGLTPGTTYYVRAYAINSLGTSYGNNVIFTTNNTLAIGDSYQGGIVFYVDGTGQKGLISATSNQTSATWGCYGTLLSNCNGTLVGTGQANTTAIVTGCSTANTAARICNDLVLNGYSDWYLPSSGELDRMYTTLKLNNLVNFTSGQYWSSSQYSSTSSRTKSFSNGTNYNSSKSSSYYVRAIRSF